MNDRRLHGFTLSGHCHRAVLMLRMLDLPFEWIEVDITKGKHKDPAFLAKNPFGLVPVLEEDGETIADSNAILTYLALRHDPERRWLPAAPVIAARVQEWLSVAAGPLVLGPAVARMHVLFGLKINVERARATADDLFAVMDAVLKGRAFLVGDGPTIADLAMYSYTAHAPEGGVALEPWKNVRAWLARVEALPRFVPMRKS